MAENTKEQSDTLEDLLYETRFLLNVLIDLLVEKKICTEEEVYNKFDNELTKAENELDKTES